jgi:hypothetical protein
VIRVRWTRWWNEPTYILEPRTYFVGDGIRAECDRSANDEECKWGGEFHFDIVGFVVKNETDEIFFCGLRICERKE